MIYNIGIIICTCLVFVWMIVLSFGRNTDKTVQTVLDVVITILVVLAAVVCFLFWRENQNSSDETEGMTVTESIILPADDEVGDETAGVQTEERLQEKEIWETETDETASILESESFEGPSKAADPETGKAKESQKKPESGKEAGQSITGQSASEHAETVNQGTGADNVVPSVSAENKETVETQNPVENSAADGNPDRQENVQETPPGSGAEPDEASAPETIVTGAE